MSIGPRQTDTDTGHEPYAACEFGCGPADESHKPSGGFIVVAGCSVHTPPAAIKREKDGRVVCVKCGCVAVTTTAGRWICGGWCPN